MLDYQPPRVALLLACLLFLCGYLYSLSLPGTFVLDDHPNLNKLSQISLPDDWPSFWQYVTNGNAGPLGRPIALLTFAIQYSAWPNNPETFKITSIAIHLLNSLLVFCAAAAIVKSSRLAPALQQRAAWIALFTATIYALNPLQISTVIYVVQRMTLLGTLFSLCTLLFYLKARLHWSHAKFGAVSYWLFFSLIAFVCAIYSKENTLTMLLVLPILELFLFEKPRYRARIWQIIACWLPLLIVGIFFYIEIPKAINIYQHSFREFTLLERLLTQSRILVDYLIHTIYPDHRYYTLLHDDFVLSKGILEPISTLYCLIFILSLLATSYIILRKLPELFSCFLAYLAAHVLESSIWALELYYEHRNNFPIFFIALAIAIMLARLSLKKARFTLLIALAYTLACAASTLSITPMWSKPIKMISWWYQNHPQSYLTQSYMIDILFETHNSGLAFDYLEQQKMAFPILTTIKKAKFYCQLKQTDKANAELSTLTITGESYETQRHHHTLAAQVNELADLDCTGIDDYQLIRIMSDLRKYAKYSDHPVINYKLGIFLYAHGKIDEGLRLIKMTFDQTNDIMTGIIYAKLSNEQGQFQEMNNTIAKLRTLPTNAEQKSIIDRLGKK